MTYQKNDYSKRPSSKDMGVRSYGAKSGKRSFDERRPADAHEGKKPYEKR